jgi:hypothetical protein
MAKYRVKLPVTLFAGVIVLTKAQASPRMHCLHSLAKNKFEIIEPIMFKVGEVIDIPGKTDKALAQRLSPMVNGRVVDDGQDDSSGDEGSGQNAGDEGAGGSDDGSDGSDDDAGENSELDLDGKGDADEKEDGSDDK